MSLEHAPQVMRPNVAADILGLTVQRLARMRLEGSGPEFVKAGKSILYTRPALESYIAKNTRRSTSDTGCAAA